MSAVKARFPKKLQFLFKPKRFKVAKGGRAGGKSWNFARALLVLGSQRKLRILCARETQKSIAESVHHLLKEQIATLGLDEFYQVQETSIKGRNGTEFIFSGIRQQNVATLKSLEDVDICWVEEAQVVTKRSWETLIPTIRKEDSEIWLSFNPELETDETYQRFVIRPPSRELCEVVTINYDDNKFLSATALRDIEELRSKDPDGFEHIYNGHCRQVVEGAIYKEQLLTVEKENRITGVPYDANHPVDLYWDLGYGDHTSIWFAQSIGFQFRLIDFLDNNLKGLDWYLKALQDKPYLYGKFYLPHDARAHELGSGKSIEEQLREKGKNVEIVTKLSVEDGIAAARLVFGKCWFDKEKCSDGIQALRHYRWKLDESLSVTDKPVYKREPLHDWASHPADAFRYFAVAIKEPERQREQVMQVVNPFGSSGWMA